MRRYDFQTIDRMRIEELRQRLRISRTFRTRQMQGAAAGERAEHRSVTEIGAKGG